MIQAQNLCKSYKKIKALNRVGLLVKTGEVCGILGPNGAGKSTLFKILCNLVTPDSGSFFIGSSKQKPIGAIIEKPALYEYLSAYNNLYILSKIQDAPHDKKTIFKALQSVGLPLDRKDPVKNYSLGMKQRLGIAISLLNEPDCLILDEPFLGLDPLGMRSLRNLIKQLAQEKKLAILVSSHLLEELSRTCDTLNIIRKGEIIQSGPTSQILDNTTENYMICGRNLSSSNIMKNYKGVIDGDCITFQLEVAKAPSFIRAIMEEKVDITYFGPERNLDELYKGK